MRRRSLFLTLLILAAAAGGLGGGLALLLKHEPAFYADRADHPDPTLGPRVLTRFGELKNDIRSKDEWGATFTAEELDAFCRETLGRGGSFAGILPDGLTDPRVSVAGDRVRVAARYGAGTWSTVLSVELRPWLVKGETNTIALELVGLWAGGLPLGTQSMLDTITETARSSNLTATWYRYDGHPVGIFHLYADQPRPTTQISRLAVRDGQLTVAGRSLPDAGGATVVGGDVE
jgi:hypothetical protein